LDVLRAVVHALLTMVKTMTVDASRARDVHDPRHDGPSGAVVCRRPLPDVVIDVQRDLFCRCGRLHDSDYQSEHDPVSVFVQLAQRALIAFGDRHDERSPLVLLDRRVARIEHNVREDEGRSIRSALFRRIGHRPNCSGRPSRLTSRGPPDRWWLRGRPPTRPDTADAADMAGPECRPGTRLRADRW